MAKPPRIEGRTAPGADRESDGLGALLAATDISNLGKAWIFLFLKFISKNRGGFDSSLILKHLNTIKIQNVFTNFTCNPVKIKNY